MIDLRPFIVLSIVLLGSSYSARVQRAASELNDAFKGRDVNKTIARVEAILARNPNLPRLTRGEILALFENITKADAAKKKQLDSVKSVKEKSPQEESLMVVLPFNANTDQNKGLEELYTRQPVTRIVGYSTTTPTIPTLPTTTNNSTERPKRKKKRKNNTRRKPMNQEIRPVYVDVTQTSTASPSLGDDLQWSPIVNGERPSVKKQNVNNGDIDVPDYMKDTLDSFQNSNNQVFVTLPNQKPSVTTTTTTSLPIQSSSPLPNISIAAQSLTPELKNLLVSLGLLNPDGTQVSTSLITTTTTRAPPPLIQYISINPTIDPASYVVFKPLPLASSRGKNRGNNEEMLSDDMRHFLASFGLTGDTEQFRSQKSFDSGNRLRKSSTTSTTTSTSTTTTTTTTTNKPSTSTSTSTDNNPNMQNDDVGFPMMINTAILTDDMKDVLENIGIVKKSRGKSKGVIFNPAMRTAGLLNKSEEKEKVDKLLSTIRELSAAEKNKSLSAEEVAEQLQNITSSLVDETKEENSFEEELVEGESSEMNYEGYEPAEEELLKLQNGFVDEELKDDASEGTSETDNNEHGNELSLDNSSSSSSPRRPSLKDSPNPPDPLSVEELHHFVESNKNEVKRQEPKKTSSDEISTTTESSSSSESSSDDNKSSSDSPDSTGSDSSSDSSAAAAEDSEDSTPSQDDLIDSFGGENPPENRPNGLYFLVDWNTFLRVGTDNKTVDLNFSPKVGDPKNFLPVTVP